MYIVHVITTIDMNKYIVNNIEGIQNIVNVYIIIYYNFFLCFTFFIVQNNCE